MTFSFFESYPGAAGKDFRLEPILDAWLAEKNKLPSNRTKGVISPSSVSLKPLCEREEALKRFVPSNLWADAYRMNPEPSLQRAFDVGHAVHDWYQNDYLGPMGILWGRWQCSRCHTRVKGFRPKNPCDCRGGGDPHRLMVPSLFPSCASLCGEASDRIDAEKVRSRGGCNHCGKWGRWEFLEPRMPIEVANIFGNCDGFIFVRGVWRVLELKTCSARVFRRLVSVGRQKDEHTKQGTIYSFASQFSKDAPPDADIRGVHYIYIEKDWPHNLAEFSEDRDEDYMRDLLGRTGRVENAVQAGTLDGLGRECESAKDIRAKNCPMKTVCFRSGMTADRARALRTLA